jgi:hypothetical protein
MAHLRTGVGDSFDLACGRIADENLGDSGGTGKGQLGIFRLCQIRTAGLATESALPWKRSLDAFQEHSKPGDGAGRFVGEADVSPSGFGHGVPLFDAFLWRFR